MEELTREQARALTDRIRGRVEEALDLIAEAFDGRADAALGYSSWDRYCHAEFPALRFEDRDQRAGAVARLADRMSNRAIGHALGIDERTVRDDLGRTLERSAGFPADRSKNTRGQDGAVTGRRGGARCRPVPVPVAITTALVHYAREAVALVADLDRQDYPPGFLTAAELAAADQFRAVVRQFSTVAEAEHTARLIREDR